MRESSRKPAVTYDQQVCALALRSTAHKIIGKYYREREKSKFLNKPQDSKILEIESGLCKARAEISLEWLSHKRGAGIADSSPKAESPQTY